MSEIYNLGLSFHEDYTYFRLWSPQAQQINLHFYKEGKGGSPLRTEPMRPGHDGTWSWRSREDLKGLFYTFQVVFNQQTLPETPGIYARAVGVNGNRAMVLDLAETNPEGWENDQKPPQVHYTDAILYELHVRDLTINPNSGVQHKGKFIGLCELGTRSEEGLSTALDHLKELGVTHLHFLPIFDFATIDETQLDAYPYQYNWGYDPKNYNTPEGSYATDPYDPKCRIRELKQMIQTLHREGFRVVMDVVYNHTYERQTFDSEYPYYYYRMWGDGNYANASGVGNETASERDMMRRFMIDSLCFWASEYHIDGFRFDLMGIHDVDTMNQIRRALNGIDDSILLYGEGWAAGDSPLAEYKRAVKRNTPYLDNIASFSDDMRDALKGRWAHHQERGFASGKKGMLESVKFGVVGATYHQQVNYNETIYSREPWARSPAHCINYVSCHDNHTLYDKLVFSNPKASHEDIIRFHKIAMALVITSQGIPFLHSGVELLRSKGGEENSYNAPDHINWIDWQRKYTYYDLFVYYKNLIALRKAHPAFRMPSNELIQEHLHFFATGSGRLLAYRLNNHANGDSWKDILLFFNVKNEAQDVYLPNGNWGLVADIAQVFLRGNGSKTAGGQSIQIPANSLVIFADWESLMSMKE